MLFGKIDNGGIMKGEIFFNMRPKNIVSKSLTHSVFMFLDRIRVMKLCSTNYSLKVGYRQCIHPPFKNSYIYMLYDRRALLNSKHSHCLGFKSINKEMAQFLLEEKRCFVNHLLT